MKIRAIHGWMAAACSLVLASSSLGAQADEGSSFDIVRLSHVLQDPRADADAKGDACLKLMGLGPRAWPAVPALIVLLQDKNELLRDYAITTLSKIGPDARAATPLLRQVAHNDPSEDLRALAKSCLKGWGDSTGGPVAAASPEAAPSAGAGVAREPASPENPRATHRDEKVPSAPTSAGMPTTAVPRATPAGSGLNRPALIARQGRIFRWAAPAGWRMSESTNGVELISPDGKQQAAYILLFRQRGQTTPEQFVGFIAQMCGYLNLRVLGGQRIPNQPQGMVAYELDCTYADPRLGLRHGGGMISIVPGYGQYDAYWQWYSSTPDDWERDKLWLPVLSRSVSIVNTAAVAGNNTLLRPRNNPLDNSGLIKVWQEKSLSEDRISQARREAMMGYERQQSPTTGRIYDMPLETYDGAKGGYHNPEHPEEILQRPRVGE